LHAAADSAGFEFYDPQRLRIVVTVPSVLALDYDDERTESTAPLRGDRYSNRTTQVQQVANCLAEHGIQRLQSGSNNVTWPSCGNKRQ